MKNYIIGAALVLAGIWFGPYGASVFPQGHWAFAPIMLTSGAAFMFGIAMVLWEALQS